MRRRRCEDPSLGALSLFGPSKRTCCSYPRPRPPSLPHALIYGPVSLLTSPRPAPQEASPRHPRHSAHTHRIGSRAPKRHLPPE
eukprot:scaffold11360_cov114-Isochrysis_galbana.AAC.11